MPHSYDLGMTCLTRFLQWVTVLLIGALPSLSPSMSG